MGWRSSPKPPLGPEMELPSFHEVDLRSWRGLLNLRPKGRERKLVWQGGSKGLSCSICSCGVGKVGIVIRLYVVCHGHSVLLSHFEFPCIGFPARAAWMISVFTFDYRRVSNTWDKASCCSEGGSGWVSKRHQQPPLVFALELLLATRIHTYHSMSCHTIPLHYTTLHYICITLRSVTLRYVTLHSIACMCIKK